MSIHRDRDNMYTLYKRDPDSRFEPRIFLWWDNSTNKYTLMPSPALKCLLKQKKNASKAAGKSRKTRGGPHRQNNSEQCRGYSGGCGEFGGKDTL